MILIADSGSTRTSWCLVKTGNDGKEKQRIIFETEGYNPCYVTADYIYDSLTSSLPDGHDWSGVRHVGFYGAGCYDNTSLIIKDALLRIFPNAKSDVAMDLLAAARSVLGDNPGFAGILGTGTNTCVYDGEKITHNIDSLGFIMGDEGSGGYMGKRLLSDFIREYMPAEVIKLMKETFKFDGEQIIEQIYSKPLANRYCASFTRFINEHQGEYPYLKELVESSFRDLFDNLITHYPNYKSYTFNCVGSVAYHFQKQLTKVAAEYGMKTGNIIADPLDGLVEYYVAKNAQ